MVQDFFLTRAWVVPLAPFVAFLLILWLRNRLPRRGEEIAVPAVFLSLLWSAGMLWEHLRLPNRDHEPTQMHFEWLRIGDRSIEMGLLVDNLSVFLATIVSFLSFLIVLYSVGYMRDAADRRPRYYLEMTLFISGMLGTVLADNYLLMFVSWEMMGLCSYLLIGYYFERPSAASAAKKAFLVTRVGDIMLLLGLLILYNATGTFSYHDVFAAAATADPQLMFWASLLIFGGAVGKSAQFPLHVWLPDAMEGPTTVSALIHAATMVKAGVFLVARSFPLFLQVADADTLFAIIGLLGGFTAFMAATIALVQFDIKRVLAYSTLSQLGYMFLALGAGGLIALHSGSGAGYTAALFHLMNHAFFKALLFLGAGSVILGLHHVQDMRLMGGLSRKLPITSVVLLLGSLSIAGLPPFSGFWSKDEVLAVVREAGSGQALFTLLWTLGVVTALLTAFYMFRMWFYTFAGQPRGPAAERAHESPRVMTVPLQILAVFAVGSGFLIFTQVASLIHFEVPGATAPSEPHGGTTLLMEILTSPFTWLSVAVAVIGVGFAHRVYVRQRPHPETLVAPLLAHDAHKFLTNLWHFDRIFMRTSQAVGLGLAKASTWFDTWIIDGAVRGVTWASRRSSDGVRKTQTGRVTTYAAGVIVGFSLLVLGTVWILARTGGA